MSRPSPNRQIDDSFRHSRTVPSTTPMKAHVIHLMKTEQQRSSWIITIIHDTARNTLGCSIIGLQEPSL